jgi:hypothetical protein
MSLDGVSIVEHCGHQMPMLDVHVLEPVSLLFTVQLIEQGLFQVNPLNIQNHDETLIVALLAEQVEHIPSCIVHVHLLMDDI